MLNKRHTLIKIDLDTKDLVEIEKNWKEICWTMDMLNLTIVGSELFPSNQKGFHRIIEIEEPLQALEIVLVQALCGSDLRRETFNMARVLLLSDAPLFWHSRWNNLYSEKLPKEEAKND
ncbi:MAG: hypothetical protein ACMG51_09640 [Ginsengibacter sp.]